MKHVSIFVLGAVAVSLVLSELWGVPYVITALGFLAFIFLGHFVHLGESAPGEWSNLESSAPVWRRSLFHLSAKGVIFIAWFWLIVKFPMLKQFGA